MLRQVFPRRQEVVCQVRRDPETDWQGSTKDAAASALPRREEVVCQVRRDPRPGGIHGDRCFRHTEHVPTIELLGDTVDDLDTLVQMALYWLRQNDPEDPEWIEKYVIYIGMMVCCHTLAPP